jgi:DnaJ-class molecular chaperone with C-terminal Zn finger domain
MKEAYPLYWPERRPRARWRPKSNFKGTFAVCRDEVISEIKRLGGKNLIISTNIPLRLDGLPYANTSEPTDPGVAVYFDYKAKPMCFACDKYRYVRENMRAIAKTIEAIRGIERWGSSDMMEQAFKGFTALPAQGSQAWRDVLEIPPDAKPTEEQIDAAFRSFAHIYHPDKGGSPDEFRRLCLARENAKRDMGYIR